MSFRAATLKMDKKGRHLKHSWSQTSKTDIIHHIPLQSHQHVDWCRGAVTGSVGVLRSLREMFSETLHQFLVLTQFSPSLWGLEEGPHSYLSNNGLTQRLRSALTCSERSHTRCFWHGGKQRPWVPPGMAEAPHGPTETKWAGCLCWVFATSSPTGH